MIKIVLIQCYGVMQPPNAEPLSIEMLAGMLNQKFGDQVTTELLLLDARKDPDGARLADQLSTQRDITIIGVAIPQSTYFLAISFLKHLRESNISPLVVLGHAIPTHSPESFLKYFPESLIVRGWGETAICEIVGQYITGQPDWHKVHGIVFRANNQTVTTPIIWPRILPSPKRIEPKSFFARIESSRGCHYDVCTFCTRQPKGPKTLSWFRFRTDRVLSEIAHLKTEGITKFTFADEDFVGNDLQGAEMIAKGIKDIGGMQFSLSLRVDNVYNPHETNEMNARRIKLFHLLKEAGLSLVYLGVESLSDTQLKRYGKGVRAIDSIKALEAIEAIGIPMELGYILFDPLLTFSELQENVVRLTSRSFSQYIGQMFNNLRIQRDSTFVNLLRLRGLLGDYNPDTIEYSYEYQNQFIAKIASICLIWKDEIDEIYSMARNIQRTEFNNSYCDNFIREMRLLDLHILEHLIESYKVSKIVKLDVTFEKNRFYLVKSLKEGLLSLPFSSPSMCLLVAAANSFLAKHEGDIVIS